VSMLSLSLRASRQGARGCQQGQKFCTRAVAARGLWQRVVCAHPGGNRRGGWGSAAVPGVKKVRPPGIEPGTSRSSVWRSPNTSSLHSFRRSWFCKRTELKALSVAESGIFASSPKMDSGSQMARAIARSCQRRKGREHAATAAVAQGHRRVSRAVAARAGPSQSQQGRRRVSRAVAEPAGPSPPEQGHGAIAASRAVAVSRAVSASKAIAASKGHRRVSRAVAEPPAGPSQPAGSWGSLALPARPWKPAGPPHVHSLLSRQSGPAPSLSDLEGPGGLAATLRV
jgi:hypothetical protein